MLQMHQPARAASASRSFSQAVDYARAIQAEGNIRSYKVENTQPRGRVISIESHTGWSPFPLFVEFPQLSDA